MISFYTPWRYEKKQSFLMFSGGMERDQWNEIGQAISEGWISTLNPFKVNVTIK